MSPPSMETQELPRDSAVCGLRTQFGAGVCYSRSVAGQAQSRTVVAKALTTSAAPMCRRHHTPLAHRATRACAVLAALSPWEAASEPGAHTRAFQVPRLCRPLSA